MLTLFILGLIAGATIAAIIVSILDLKWFLNYSKNLLKESPEKKVLIVNLNNVYNDLRKIETIKSLPVSEPAIKKEKMQIENKSIVKETPVVTQAKKEMLLSELEEMCKDSPYVVAEYDEQLETIDNYEAVKSESTGDDFIKCMEENDGLILVGA